MSSARSRDGGPPNDPRTNFEAFKDAAVWIVGGLLLIQLFIYVDPRVYREVGDDGSCEVSAPLHFFYAARRLCDSVHCFHAHPFAHASTCTHVQYKTFYSKCGAV